MATEIRIPDIGTTVDQVILVRWIKQEGEAVKRGDPLCEVETDKAVSELESIAQGVLLKQVISEGSEIEKGTIVAYIGKEDEEIPTLKTETAQDKSKAPDAKKAVPRTHAPEVSLLIRNLAEKEGVDLSQIIGTGPGGKITREDVLHAREAGLTAEISKGKPLSRNQSVVAKRVARSQREIPPIDLTSRFDMTAVIKERKHLKNSGTLISFDAFFLLAVTNAMKSFPRFRSRLESYRVIVSENVNPGIAISIGHDLLTPVIRNAEKLALEQIEEAIQDLLEKAVKNQFTTDDLKGGTLTVSNLGMYPIQSFSAVIPPDQVAILSIGTIEETPVAKDGKVEVVPLVSVTLSVDHRLINGREAAEFLAEVKQVIETE